MSEFKDRLRSVIKAAELTQEEFAKKCQVSRTQVFRYLSGEQRPGQKFIERLKHQLPHIDIAWLMTGDIDNGQLYRRLDGLPPDYKIKEIRKRANLTQEEFAETLGIDKSHVSKLEKRAAQPSKALMNLIYKVFIEEKKEGTDMPEYGKELTPTEKLDAAIKLVAFLDKEVPENDQIEVAAIAIKSIRGNFVVKHESGVI
jgi:transcriptional regulator with XRE-family HTH domain